MAWGGRKAWLSLSAVTNSLCALFLSFLTHVIRVRIPRSSVLLQLWYDVIGWEGGERRKLTLSFPLHWFSVFFWATSLSPALQVPLTQSAAVSILWYFPACLFFS